MPVQEVTFDPELVFWLSAGIPSNIDTCRIIQQSCVGNNTQYGSGQQHPVCRVLVLHAEAAIPVMCRIILSRRVQAV